MRVRMKQNMFHEESEPEIDMSQLFVKHLVLLFATW